MPFDQEWLVRALTIWIPLVLSLSVHEWAHARAAWQLGDDTAALMGRMTLNPFAHIDPVGTVLLPLMGVPFGWAKPVPVNPLRFRRNVTMKKGMMLTAAAGPASNLVLAAGSILLLALLTRFRPDLVAPGSRAELLLRLLIFMNVLLAVFNMLPIPPLDGSRVADALMPRRLRPAWERFYRLGPLALAAVIILPLLMGVHLFGWALEATAYVRDAVIRLLGG
jgi:Zn-dependent protease